LLIEVEGFPWSASSSCLLVGFVSNGSYSYPSTQARDHLINAISVEEEQGRAQSKPTHAKDIRSRLGNGQRPRSKVVLFFP